MKKQIVVYIIFGVLTTIINIAIYQMLVTLNVTYVLSTIIANIMSIAFAFVTNKQYVFNSREWKLTIALSELLRFFASRTVSFVIDVLLMIILVELSSINDFVAKCIINIIVIVLNYVFSKFLVFKQKNSYDL